MFDKEHDTLAIIIGLGPTGLSCARYLSQKGVNFELMDTRNEPPAYKEFKEAFPQIPLYLGGINQNRLLDAKKIIISPGLSTEDPIFRTCHEHRIPMIGDIELFAKEAKAPICAITGSNGKSTVTSLVGKMVQTAGLNVRVGGNLGTPALSLLKNSEPDWYVLELSSFQLETTYSLSPAVATILNITPDHMDRYLSFEKYINAKQRIYQAAEFIVWNRDDAHSFPAQLKTNNKMSFGLKTPKADEFGIIDTKAGLHLALGEEALLAVRDLSLKGSHNWANALAALSLGHAMALPMAAMLQTLQTFKGLDHRCQWVAEHKGVNWFNDSKGTNVGASIAALTGLAKSIEGKVILIAGGQGKGADFSSLKEPVALMTRAVILMGEDALKIAKSLDSASAIFYASDMDEAVHLAARQAEQGDAVLLSPACASFDMFKNFEHRGEVFMASVKALLS